MGAKYRVAVVKTGGRNGLPGPYLGGADQAIEGADSGWDHFEGPTRSKSSRRLSLCSCREGRELGCRDHLDFGDAQDFGISLERRVHGRPFLEGTLCTVRVLNEVGARAGRQILFVLNGQLQGGRYGRR